MMGWISGHRIQKLEPDVPSLLRTVAILRNILHVVNRARNISTEHTQQIRCESVNSTITVPGAAVLVFLLGGEQLGAQTGELLICGVLMTLWERTLTVSDDCLELRDLLA